MKKILSLGIASAVLALTAVSASAAVTVTGPTTVKNGDKITVTFVADSAVEALTAAGFTISTTGLTYVDGGGSGYNNETGKFGTLLMDGAKAGDTLATFTYTVTAKEGEKVGVNVSDLSGFGTNTTITPFEVTVTVEQTTSSDTSSTTSSETPSNTSSETPSNTSSTPSTTDPSTNPPTGVALAIFPAVIAGAAVVVAKKKRG